MTDSACPLSLGQAAESQCRPLPVGWQRASGSEWGGQLASVPLRRRWPSRQFLSSPATHRRVPSHRLRVAQLGQPERLYPPPRHLLAVVHTLKTLRSYLLDEPFELHTDNASLQVAASATTPLSNLLAEHQPVFKVVHIPGRTNPAEIQAQAVTGSLSAAALPRSPVSQRLRTWPHKHHRPSRAGGRCKMHSC